MSLCVSIANGQVVPTGEPVDACSGFIVLSSQDYGAAVSVHSLWDFKPELAVQYFGSSFSLVLVSYLTAWAFAQVLSFIKRR